MPTTLHFELYVEIAQWSSFTSFFVVIILLSVPLFSICPLVIF
uniref:Uncharacterized protein n=1 Tax=Rhizophora mucronata TaxID=61149 RepID=A0A2P2LZW9_RHIMU